MVQCFFNRKGSRAANRSMFTGNRGDKRYPLGRAISPQNLRIEGILSTSYKICFQYNTLCAIKLHSVKSFHKDV